MDGANTLDIGASTVLGKRGTDTRDTGANKGQVLFAIWDACSSYKVPDGIDLEDTVNVKWYVRCDTLYVETRDGRSFEVENNYEDGPFVHSKWPNRHALQETVDNIEQEESDIDAQFGFEEDLEEKEEQEEKVEEEEKKEQEE